MAKKQVSKTPTLAKWRKAHPRAATVGFSIQGAPWGGMSYATGKILLDEAGIPSQKEYSPYVGSWGVSVPKMHERKASRILLGR